MALTKEIVVDQVTVTENGTIQYREATRISQEQSLFQYHMKQLNYIGLM
jgi:hypothetical protein